MKIIDTIFNKFNKNEKAIKIENWDQGYIEYDMHERELTQLNAGNDFNVDNVINKVKFTLIKKNAKPQTLYFGFDIATCKGDIVLWTNKGYVFVPFDGKVPTVGGCWSDFVFWELYCAQEKLSAFLEELGEALNVKVVDRCLYIAYLDYEIYSEYDPSVERIPKEVKTFYLQKQKEFREKYATQLEEVKTFNSWLEYHNHGFAFHYIPTGAILHAKNEIYENRDMLEKYDQWKDAKKVICALNDVLRNMKQ